MDHVIVTINGGGIFSLYHQAIAIILQRYEYYLDKIGSFEIIIESSHFLKNKKIFNDFFDYEYQKNIITSRNQVQLNIINDGCIHFIKVDCHYFDLLKSIVKINKINHKITNDVNNFINKNNINENTLTVHIRLTDMNVTHANDYGVYSFDNYTDEIDKALEIYPEINSIYVASDNNESIQKLVSFYNEKIKVISFENPYRVEKEISDNFKYITTKLNDMPELPVKVFTEVLIGAKGGHFIGRISDVSNFIILYSDSIKTIKYLN